METYGARASKKGPRARTDARVSTHITKQTKKKKKRQTAVNCLGGSFGCMYRNEKVSLYKDANVFESLPSD